MSPIELWRKGELGCSQSFQPIRVVATVEARCNLRCSHCYWAHDLENEAVADWFSIAERVARFGVPVAYAGRLLTPRGIQFLRACISAGVSRLGIIDNGYTIFEAPDLLPRFECVNISIDGSREAHDRQRGLSGSFDRAWEAVLELKRQGFDPIVASAFSPLTFNGWDEFEERLAEHDVRLSCTLVASVPEARRRGEAVFTDQESLRRAFQRLAGGIPKLVNLYELDQVKTLAPILREFAWTLDESDGDCLTAELPNGGPLIYRPSSSQLMSEIGLRWDGKFYCPLIEEEGVGVSIDPDNLPLAYFEEVGRRNQTELEVWSTIFS